WHEQCRDWAFGILATRTTASGSDTCIATAPRRPRSRARSGSRSSTIRGRSGCARRWHASWQLNVRSLRGAGSSFTGLHSRVVSPRAVNTPGQVLFASLVGTAIEYFDFYIYGTAAVLVFPQLFFPGSDPVVATLASLLTFGLAFVA